MGPRRWGTRIPGINHGAGDTTTYDDISHAAIAVYIVSVPSELGAGVSRDSAPDETPEPSPLALEHPIDTMDIFSNHVNVVNKSAAANDDEDVSAPALNCLIRTVFTGGAPISNGPGDALSCHACHTEPEENPIPNVGIALEPDEPDTHTK